MKDTGKSWLRRSLGVLLLGLVSACGGGGVDQSTATNAALAVGTAENTVGVDLQAAAGGGNGGGLTATVSGSTYTYGGTLTNASGGSLSVSGTGSSNAGSVTSNLNITFTNWVDKATGLTLNGSLSESAMTIVAASSTTTETSTGTLTLSGAATGTVTYDLMLSISGACVSYSGQVGGFTVSVKVGC